MNREWTDCYRINYPKDALTTYGAVCGVAIHALCDEVDRLQRIEKAARELLQHYEQEGDVDCFDERLRVALEAK